MTSNAFHEIEDRLNSKRAVSYDVFAISMHNMDRFYEVDRFYGHAGVLGPGEHAVELKGIYPGGAGANTAVALSRLGLRTAVAGAVAPDGDGRTLRKALAENGINDDFVLPVTGRGRPPTGHANIYTRSPYPNIITTYSGANKQFKDEISKRGMYRILVEALKQSRIIHFSPVRRSELELYGRIIQDVGRNSIVTFKPGSMYGSHAPGRLHAIIDRASVLFLREHELDLLLADSPILAKTSSDSPRPQQKVNAMLAWRHSRMGRRSHPLIIVLRTSQHHRDPGYLYVGWGVSELQDGTFTDEDNRMVTGDSIVDTTGEGDAIAAGVLFALLQSRPPVDCANLAYVLAMSVSTRFGCRTGLPSLERIPRHWRRWFTDDAPDWLRIRTDGMRPHARDTEAPATGHDVDMSRFTDRELDVIALLKLGASNREIAERLRIAEGTASVHVSHILRKLGVPSRQKAVALLEHPTSDAAD